MIRSYEQMGKLHGIKVARNAPPISHLFFAGDSYSYFKANAQEASNLKHFLNDYSVASGQCINMDKSSLSYSRNVNDEVKETMEEIMGVKSSDGNGNYLGLPMIIGKNKKEILSFIKQRIVNRIQGWNHRFLSRVGREILLKTVVQALPSYAMGVFLLPIGLIKEIESIMNSYWWRRGADVEDRIGEFIGNLCWI